MVPRGYESEGNDNKGDDGEGCGIEYAEEGNVHIEEKRGGRWRWRCMVLEVL